MNGVLLIDKPEGFTSFDVVAIIRRLAKQKKVGHTGTLDPMATGVLPVLLGEATKAQSILPNTQKEYVSTFKLGITTDTQDVTGKILSRKEVSVDYRTVSSVLDNFRGEIKQVPPMFSAIKKDGQRLYSLARQGIEVERVPRTIKINSLELLKFNPETSEVQIKVSCSQGTYIRTLCHDIGETLGCGAAMTQLRRTVACGFSESQTFSIDDVKSFALTQSLEQHIVPIEKLFSCYPMVIVSESQSKRFLNGGGLSLERLSISKDINDNVKFCVYSRLGLFCGIGIINKAKQELSILKIFKTAEGKSIESSLRN